MRSFTIATDRIGPRRWCWVRIHDDVEQMRVAAQRLNPRVSVDRTGGGWTDCYGCFQPAPAYPHPQDPEWAANGYAGTIRLAKGWITAEIVAHELIHAAARIYRMNINRELRLGVECHGREEDLAYIYGELFAAMQDKLEGAA